MEAYYGGLPQGNAVDRQAGDMFHLKGFRPSQAHGVRRDFERADDRVVDFNSCGPSHSFQSRYHLKVAVAEQKETLEQLMPLVIELGMIMDRIEPC